jgi:hypothetical protein
MPIPTPEPGLVISYAYLWHHEHEAGWDEGRKDRPSVIVLAVGRQQDEETIVIVLPITHRSPADPASAVEIPIPVKRHLGLRSATAIVTITDSCRLGSSIRF